MFTFTKKCNHFHLQNLSKGEKEFVAVGSSSQFTLKGHLQTISSQPQGRSSLEVDASWNENSL